MTTYANDQNKHTSRDGKTDATCAPPRRQLPNLPTEYVHPDTLDAIHLTTAQQLETELSRLITYDERLGAAAQAIGCSVIAPS